MKYKIGTRGSKLALAQAEYVRICLAEAFLQDDFEIQIIRTKGDWIKDRPLDEIGGSGLFVKEIERALLDDEIQMAVHSMKDMPCRLPAGLVLASVWKREDPRDVLVLREKKSLSELPPGAVIGTGSKRRAFQLRMLRPDLKVVNLRGNVDTRLRRMEEQELDGIILAAAGLKRLGLEDRITQYFSVEEMAPAPTQGALAIELAAGNQELLDKLAAFADAGEEPAVRAERAFLREMGADCHLPVGAYAQCSSSADGGGNPQVTLRAVYGNRDGTRMASCCVSAVGPETAAQAAAKEIRSKLAGNVVLLGAGPGDPDLLTVAGVYALQNADCVVYDRLVSPELLSYAQPGCELIYVGKENHHHTMPQEEINELLVRKAMEYSSVVRLKGGDPYVFGRGGEEALYLREKGVPVSVVPGISSAIAGLSCAGIPVTHRGTSMAFHVLTAHDKRDGLADIDFTALTRDTCVFLMGLGEVEEICRRMVEGGRAADTPAAVISHATTARQRTCVGILQDLASRVKEAGLSSPALIVVGEVVKLRDALNFFEERPCFGQRYLVAETISLPCPQVGRGRASAAEEAPAQCASLSKITSAQRVSLSRLLKWRGAQVDVAAAGQIVPIAFQLEREQLQEIDWLVFTSKNGVRAFFRNLFESGLDVRALGHVRIAVIGRGTAEALSDYGIVPDFIPRNANSVHFAKELSGILEGNENVWYVHDEVEVQRTASEPSRPFSVILGEKCRVTEVPMYRNQAPENQISDKALLEYDRIYFTNGRSIERLLGQRPAEVLRRLDERNNIFVIGIRCQKTLEKLGISHMHVAREASYSALAELRQM